MPHKDDAVALRKERDYLLSQLDETAQELTRLDLRNLTLGQEKRQALAAFKFIRVMHEKVERASTVDGLYLSAVKTIVSDLYVDSSALFRVDPETGEVTILASSGLPESIEGIHLSQGVSKQEILTPAFSNNKTAPQSFHQAVRSSFRVPYFVWYPIAEEEDGMLVLFAGNRIEDMVFKQPFSEASLETFGAISSAILMRRDNIVTTQEMLRKKNERIDFLAEMLKTSPISVIATDKDA